RAESTDTPGNSCLPPGAAAVELTETCALIFAGPLVFLGQHDRDHPLRDRRISWVGGVVREGLVVVIDLEKDPMAIRIERAKVVLFAWIVGVAKVVEHRDGFDDAGDGFGAEGGNARGHHRHALGKVLTQFIVQRADARSLAVHDGPPDLGEFSGAGAAAQDQACWASGLSFARYISAMAD